MRVGNQRLDLHPPPSISSFQPQLSFNSQAPPEIRPKPGNLIIGWTLAHWNIQIMNDNGPKRIGIEFHPLWWYFREANSNGDRLDLSGFTVPRSIWESWYDFSDGTCIYRIQPTYSMPARCKLVYNPHEHPWAIRISPVNPTSNHVICTLFAWAIMLGEAQLVGKIIFQTHFYCLTCVSRTGSPQLIW